MRRLAEYEPVDKKNKPLIGPKTVLDELLDKPCPIHSVLLNTNTTHNLRPCWVVRQVSKSGEAILEVTPSIRRSTTPTYNDTEVLTIYETFSSKEKMLGNVASNFKKKLRSRKIYLGDA